MCEISTNINLQNSIYFLYGYLPVWCGHYGAAVMVRPLWRGDSMVLVFYSAGQWCDGAKNFFALWNFWWPL